MIRLVALIALAWLIAVSLHRLGRWLTALQAQRRPPSKMPPAVLEPCRRCGAFFAPAERRAGDRSLCPNCRSG